jgi:thymidylate synthase
MIPDELIGNLGDTHIYENQIEGIKEQLKRKPYELPTLKITDKVIFNGNIDNMLNSCNKDDFIIENYKHHPLIKMPLSN